MAAGLGTRLRPLTYEVPKPMVPVVNRPVMEHILELLPPHGFTEVISNLHWFPDTIRDRIGDGSTLGIELTYSHEDELLGTAGGVRNVAEFFGEASFLVMAGDALTDIDLTALRSAHEHRPTDPWIAGLDRLLVAGRLEKRAGTPHTHRFLERVEVALQVLGERSDVVPVLVDHVDMERHVVVQEGREHVEREVHHRLVGEVVEDLRLEHVDHGAREVR